METDCVQSAPCYVYSLLLRVQGEEGVWEGEYKLELT